MLLLPVLGLSLNACPGVDPDALKSSSGNFIMGFDASYVTRVEDKGGVYKDANGTPGDIFKILSSYQGVDYIRLRVWNNPTEGYDNKRDVLKLAKRTHQAGMKILLDFHYSDSWADPSKQNKPAAWANMNPAQLNQAVYDYSADVAGALIAQGTPPDVVQIGNEITSGMLWPEGRVGTAPEHWDQLAQLINSGIAGVKSTGSKAKIMIHINKGGKDNVQGRWFFDHLTARGVKFDLIGLSYYSWWNGQLDVPASNIRDLIACYKKPVIIVETSYPFTLRWNDRTNNVIGQAGQLYPGYEATAQGQKDFFQALVRAVKSAGGAGLFYWGGEWMAPQPQDQNGSKWENLALFDFNGKALPALEVYRNH